jgi:hypothetical protein
VIIMLNHDQTYRLSRVLAEAAQFRVLRSIYERDLNVDSRTAATLRECFKSYRDDAKLLHGIADE